MNQNNQQPGSTDLPPLPKAKCLLPGVYAYLEGDMLAYARDAIAASRRAKRPMSPEIKAAIEEAHKTGATSAVASSGELLFINYGHDLGDSAHLECTACGGSGHIEDQKLIAASLPDVAMPEPVGEAGTMPGTSGFTMACFKAEQVPVGTKLYLAAQPAEGSAQPVRCYGATRLDQRCHCATCVAEGSAQVAQEKCKRCSGTGLVHNSSPVRGTCPICHGSGATPAAVVRAAPAGLESVIAWIETEEGLCQAVETAANIKNADEAFVRLSTVKNLLGAAEGATQAGNAHGTVADIAAGDAQRWEFMMRIADNPDGPEAHAMQELGNEAMETDRPESEQLRELVDMAMARIDGDKQAEQGGGQ